MSIYPLIVCMGASELRGTMELYLRQLAEAKIDTHVRDNSDMPNRNGGGNLGFRVRAFRELANRFKHYDKMVITDGFDVTFYGDEESLLSKIPETRLLHAAEKNFYPSDEFVQSKITKTTPWCYCNGGMAAGTPESFLRWCDLAERHPFYDPYMLDQKFLNMVRAEADCDTELISIDTRTDLFFCLHSGYEELEFEHGKPVNTLLGTRPSFLHANGKWDASEMFAKYERSLQ